MALDCNTKNPLKRDGTSQDKRELAALQPENAPVDERTRQDLLRGSHGNGGSNPPPAIRQNG